MARAEIYLEDAADGSLALVVRYMGGPADVKSGAHQVANLLRIYAESILEAKQEPEVKTDAIEGAKPDEPRIQQPS